MWSNKCFNLNQKKKLLDRKENKLEKCNHNNNKEVITTTTR